MIALRLLSELLLLLGISNITAWAIWNPHHAPLLGASIFVAGFMLGILEFTNRNDL